MKNTITISFILCLILSWNSTGFSRSAPDLRAIAKNEKQTTDKKATKRKRWKQAKKAVKTQLKKMQKAKKIKFGGFLLFLGLTAAAWFLLFLFILILPGGCMLFACSLSIWNIVGIIATIGAYLFFLSKI